jgi:flagellar assembly protein FliH
VNGLGPSDPSIRPARPLRRLDQPPAVSTTYERRGQEPESTHTRREAAFRQGYDDGYAEGVARSALDAERMRGEESKRVGAALSALTGAVAAVHDAERRMWAEVHAAAPRLAFELLEALLAQEARSASDPGREAIVRALSVDDGDQAATVRLNPADLATLGELGDLGAGRELRVVADPTVEPGGALVAVGRGMIDARLSTALARVGEVLFGPGDHGGRDDRAA